MKRIALSWALTHHCTGPARKAAQAGEFTRYALLSLWPINKHNGPVTEAEAPGLQFVAAHPEQGYYREEELGGERYVTAIYADKAISGTCVACHNEHPDSPHRDFKLGGGHGRRSAG